MVVASFALWASRASAADAVIVATPDASDPIAARAEDELEALGFQVIEAIVDGDATVTTILVGREYAKAVVHVRPPGADVWVVDPVTHAPVLRESVTPLGKKTDQVALRAVEVVRGSLLQLPKKPEPPPPPPPPPKAPKKPAPPPPPPPPPPIRSVELALGAGLASSSLGLAAQLGVHAVGAFDLDVLCAYAPARRSIAEPEGTARLGLGVAAVRARYRVAPFLHLGLGGGFAAGFARATAAPPFEASSTTLLSPAAIASATLKVRLVGPLDLWLDLGAVLTRPMVLRVLDRDVARVSATVLAIGGLGLSWR